MYEEEKINKDEFVEEIVDKMNHGVSRLSPIARRLHFSLTWEFLSHSRKNTIKTLLFPFAKYLGIIESDLNDIVIIIKNAFQAIHNHTFVKYEFEFSTLPLPDHPYLIVSTIDNKEELKAIIERMSVSKKDMS